MTVFRVVEPVHAEMQSGGTRTETCFGADIVARVVNGFFTIFIFYFFFSGMGPTAATAAIVIEQRRLYIGARDAGQIRYQLL